MTRNIAKIYQGQKVVSEDGTLEPWFVDAWNDLVDRSGGETTDFVGNIINGRQPLIDVKIVGLGSVSGSLDAVNTNLGSVTVTASASSMAATTNRSSVYGSVTGSGLAETNSVTVTAFGGTAPYAFAWTYVSGDVFTINSPSADTTTFTTTLTELQSKSGFYMCTVTDDALATFGVEVSVTASSVLPGSSL